MVEDISSPSRRIASKRSNPKEGRKAPAPDFMDKLAAIEKSCSRAPYKQSTKIEFDLDNYLSNVLL